MALCCHSDVRPHFGNLLIADVFRVLIISSQKLQFKKGHFNVFACCIGIGCRVRRMTRYYFNSLWLFNNSHQYVYNRLIHQLINQSNSGALCALFLFFRRRSAVRNFSCIVATYWTTMLKYFLLVFAQTQAAGGASLSASARSQHSATSTTTLTGSAKFE